MVWQFNTYKALTSTAGYEYGKNEGEVTLHGHMT